jgi:hypothetical protein
MSDASIISLQIIAYLTALILGYSLGKISRLSSSNSSIDPKGSFLNQKNRQRKEVIMDERTFVTALSTDTLQKKSGELGTSTTVNDDVAASVSKLAQLKKNK